jgi:hypothetical protein
MGANKGVTLWNNNGAGRHEPCSTREDATSDKE